MEPKRILFLNICPQKEIIDEPLSLAVLSLGSQIYHDHVLQQYYNIVVKNFPSQITLYQFKETIGCVQPHLLCLSINMWNDEVLIELLLRSQCLLAEMLVIAGGYSIRHASSANIGRFSAVDVFVKGEGEDVLKNILYALKDVPSHKLKEQARRLQYKDVSNIESFDDKRHEINQTNLSCVYSPYISYDQKPSFYNYLKPNQNRWNQLWWECSRGCIYDCAFCDVNIEKARMRHLPLRRVMREFDTFMSRNVRFLFNVDPIFGGKSDNAKEILYYISKKRHKIQIHGFFRIELLDHEFIKLMKDAPIEFAEFGLETMCANVPKEIRNNAYDKIPEKIALMDMEGLLYQINLIAGLPGEDSTEFIKTIRFVIEKANPERLRIFHLKVIKGSKLERDKKRYDLVWDEESRTAKRCFSYRQQDITFMMDFANTTVALHKYLVKNAWFGDIKKFKNIDFFKWFYDYVNRQMMLHDKRAKNIIKGDQKANHDKAVMHLLTGMLGERSNETYILPTCT